MRILSLVPLLLAVCTVAADDYTVEFVIQLDSSRRGSVLVTVRETKAPIAAQRFRELVNSGFYDGCSIYRVVPAFLVQFGISSNVTLQRQWDMRGTLPDETHIMHPDWNMRGTVAFATNGPASRGTQIIVNYDDNHLLDSKGFVPFGRVVRGMDVLSRVYSGYRERPQATEIRRRGGAYLKTEYPRLSTIVAARQVSFIEEPLVLSKNYLGLLITLGMVFAVVLCAGAVRYALPRLGIVQKSKGYKKTTVEPLYDEDVGDDDEMDGDRGRLVDRSS